MENQGRRGRRRSRGIRDGVLPYSSSLYKNTNLYIAGVVFLALMMLQLNCWRNCHAKQELMKIATSVEDIAKHLIKIQCNYQLMENKFGIYSKELPKLEEQIAAIESMAQQARAVRSCGWNPRIDPPLPFVDVKLNTRNPIRETPTKCATKLNPLSQKDEKNNNNTTKII